MRQFQALFFLAILCMAQTVLANKPLKDTQSPLTDLQNQIDALNDRIQTLESNTPDSSVEGSEHVAAKHGGNGLTALTGIKDLKRKFPR